MYLLYMVGFLCIFIVCNTTKIGKCSHMLSAMVLHDLFIYVLFFRLQVFIVLMILESSVKALLVNY